MKTHIKIPSRSTNPFSGEKKSNSLMETKASSNRTHRTFSSSRTHNRAHDKSLPMNSIPMEQSKILQIEAPPLNTFFDDILRKQYHQKLINIYFQEPKESDDCSSPVFNRSEIKNSGSFNLRKLVKHARQSHTAQGMRKQPYLMGYFDVQEIGIQDLRRNKKDKLLNATSAVCEYHNSPGKEANMIIKASEEDFKSFGIRQQKQESKKRPFSEQRISRKNPFFASNMNSIDTESFALSLYSKLSDNCEETVEEFRISTSPDRMKKLGIGIDRNPSRTTIFETYNITEKRSRSRVSEFSVNNMELYQRSRKIQRLGLIPQLFENMATGTNDLKLKPPKSLREELYSMIQQRKGSQTIFVINPKPEYENLFRNNNQWLIDIIASLCTQFKSIEGKVVHCKININSIYRTTKQKQVRIDNWEHSAIKQVLTIREQTITSYFNPLIGTEGNWQTVPEYLPPEMLKDYVSNWKNKEIWSAPSATNMWFVGCLIFQILTLTPIWIPYRCLIKGQTEMRRGVLSVRRRAPEQILSRQLRLVSKSQKMVRQLSSIFWERINPAVLQVMERCLKIDPKQRITPEEVVNTLKF